MDPFLQLINSGVGLGVACLVLAVWWLARINERERNARIALLEQSSERCAADRMELHKQMGELQQEVRGLMKNMIDQLRATDSHFVCQSVSKEAREQASSAGCGAHCLRDDKT